MGAMLKVSGPLSAVELMRAASKERRPKVRERILIIRHVLSGNSVPQSAAAFSLKERQIRTWVHRYNKDGLAGLADRPRPGAPVRLKPQLVAAFKARVEAGPDASDELCVYRGKDIRRLLRKEFDARYSLPGVYVLLHRLKYSSLVPRPRHPKSDPEAQADFKKTSQHSWRASSNGMRTSSSKSGSKMKRASASRAR